MPWYHSMVCRKSLVWLVLLGLLVWTWGCTQTPGSAGSIPAPTSTTKPASLTFETSAPGATVTQAPPEPSRTASPPPVSPAATSEPTSTPPPTPLACWQTGGRLVDASLRTRRLPLPLEYRVYLPPCYDELAEQRFPVLYLIHGQNSYNDQWDRLGVDEAANRLIADKVITPFLIVMPRDRKWTQPSEDPFGEVLVEELIPAIDQLYRTIPERRYRAVGGLSRGAGWAVHLGLSRWELFGALGAHSLPVFWEDTVQIRRWLAAIPPEQLPRIYIDIGDKDRSQILSSAIWFEELLTELDIPHEWYLFPGYHEEAYWQAHVEQYLAWYAADW